MTWLQLPKIRIYWSSTRTSNYSSWDLSWVRLLETSCFKVTSNHSMVEDHLNALKLPRKSVYIPQDAHGERSRKSTCHSPRVHKHCVKASSDSNICACKALAEQSFWELCPLWSQNLDDNTIRLIVLFIILSLYSKTNINFGPPDATECAPVDGTRACSERKKTNFLWLGHTPSL